MHHSGRIEPPQQVLKHQANDSTAKYHWSFSKSSRFGDNKGYTQTISYDLPNSLSKRKSGIGYGSRSKNFDGFNTTNPPPGLYELGTSFENRKQKKGYSFGQNREELRYANYTKQHQITPAAYALNQSLVKSTRAYSMRPKTAYPKNYFLPNQEETGRIKQLPGPGKYETIDLMGSGKNFCNSKNKTQNQKTFQGGNRFYTSKITPGPSDYKIGNTIEPDGFCVLSTMKSSGKRSILNDKRELYLAGNKFTPGPGNYEKPSDFGHYTVNKPSSRPKTSRN